MNLDLFNNLLKSTKENNIFQNFIKELGEFLENNGNNEKTLLQKMLDGKTLTTRYRDEINIQKNNIIKEYSEKHSEQGELYYVHNKRSDNTYGVVSYKNGESGINIGIKESELPKGASLDSILREKDGKFYLDKTSTENLQKEIAEMIRNLLEEQNNKMNSQRVEGHIYEFVEKAGNIVELMDVTNYSGECFEEIDFPSELLNKATQGTMFQYTNGEYHLFDK